MRSFSNSICILLLAGSLAAAQTTPAKSPPAKPAEKPANLGNLPTFPRKPRSIPSCISSLAIRRI